MIRVSAICSILLLLFSYSLKGSNGDGKEEEEKKSQYPFVTFLFDYMEVTYQGKDLSFDDLIYVAVQKQKLYLIRDSLVIKEYDISTSKKGVGMLNGSFKTPHGLHKVRDKIGKGVPKGGIFVHRQYQGKEAELIKDTTDLEKDLITSRILWLDGLEEGVNSGGKRDTYRRGIYIHGTHEEGMIGKPVSHGCIRMRNDDVIELFDRSWEGIPVIILNN